MTKNTKFAIALCLFAVVVTLLFTVVIPPTVKYPQQVTDTLRVPLYNGSADYELSLVAADLMMYDYLSYDTEQLILKTLKEAVKEFPVPIGMMHGVSRTESEYRFWIDHPTVNVNVRGKRVTTNAIGIGGVIWEFWGDTLKHYDVAHARSDLYLPDVGIRAQACVLWCIIKEVMKDSTTKESNIVSRVQSNYYGAYSNLYMQRIKEVTSDLWMKRMAREIDYVYHSNIQRVDVDTVSTRAVGDTATVVFSDSAKFIER